MFRGGLNVVLKADGAPTDLDESLRLLLFQAVRELLFNVVKHAETLQAVIDLERLDDQVRITVSDEGKGFDTGAVMNNRKVANSLLSIQDRLNLMGCNLEVNSEPGHGTRIVINCPT